MSRLNLEHASNILVEAVFATDSEVASRYGITRQTVYRYRRRIEPDNKEFSPELLRMFTFKLKQARDVEGWADHLTAPIRKAVSFICQACDDLDTASPDALRAVTDALRVLVSADLSRKVIDRQLATSSDDPSGSRPDAPGARQVFAQLRAEA